MTCLQNVTERKYQAAENVPQNCTKLCITGSVVLRVWIIHQQQFC